MATAGAVGWGLRRMLPNQSSRAVDRSFVRDSLLRATCSLAYFGHARRFQFGILGSSSHVSCFWRSSGAYEPPSPAPTAASRGWPRAAHTSTGRRSGLAWGIV